jgi:hypothetical protein
MGMQRKSAPRGVAACACLYCLNPSDAHLHTAHNPISSCRAQASLVTPTALRGHATYVCSSWRGSLCLCFSVLLRCLRRTHTLCTQSHFLVQEATITGDATCTDINACNVSLSPWRASLCLSVLHGRHYTRVLSELNTVIHTALCSSTQRWAGTSFASVGMDAR